MTFWTQPWINAFPIILSCLAVLWESSWGADPEFCKGCTVFAVLLSSEQPIGGYNHLAPHPPGSANAFADGAKNFTQHALYPLFTSFVIRKVPLILLKKTLAYFRVIHILETLDGLRARRSQFFLSLSLCWPCVTWKFLFIKLCDITWRESKQQNTKAFCAEASQCHTA